VEDLTIVFRQLVVQVDFVWRRMIVRDAETIKGIGGGIVGSRYLGVPRAIISVKSPAYACRRVQVGRTGKWMALTWCRDTSREDMDS
jgi:hypothetical protein